MLDDKTIIYPLMAALAELFDHNLKGVLYEIPIDIFLFVLS